MNRKDTDSLVLLKRCKILFGMTMWEFSQLHFVYSSFLRPGIEFHFVLLFLSSLSSSSTQVDNFWFIDLIDMPFYSVVFLYLFVSKSVSKIITGRRTELCGVWRIHDLFVSFYHFVYLLLLFLGGGECLGGKRLSWHARNIVVGWWNNLRLFILSSE